MPRAQAEIAIKGIKANGNWTGGPTQTLYVPLESIDSFRAGFVEPVAGKVQNDPREDLSTNLTTVALVTDLSGGAFSKYFSPDNRRYWQPNVSGTGDTLTTGPLPWTAAPPRTRAPLMCGASWAAQNYQATFKDIVDFKGNIYAIDVENWRVWQYDNANSRWRVYSNYGSAGWRIGKKTIDSVATAGGLWEVTSTAHGLVNGCFVDVVGATGSGASTLNGRWEISNVAADTFRLVGSAPSGSPDVTSAVWYLTAGTGTVTNVVSNGGPNLCRVTSAAHGLITGQSITLVGINGATGATGTFLITKIDANTFDLQGSSFGGTYTDGGEWADTYNDAAALKGRPTELFAKGDSNSDVLIVGVGTNGDGTFARKTTNGTTWSNFTVNSTNTNAQHFVQIGQRLWYSTGNQLKEDASANARNTRVGMKRYDVGRLLWYSNKILISKRDGWYEWDPRDRLPTMIYDAPKLTQYNGDALVLHAGSAWCNFDDNWVEYDLTSIQEHQILLVEGTLNKPFYLPQVIAAYSAGKQLYLVLKVTTTEATPNYNYYLTLYTGKAGGYHPVFLVTTTQAGSSTFQGQGVYWFSDKLFYSFGAINAIGESYTGYLATDGEVPMSATGLNYGNNVALDLGEIDLGRPNLDKYFHEIRYSLTDQAASAGGKVKFYYRLLTDTSWTLLGESSAGTQSNSIMAFPAAGSNIAGVVAPRIRIKIELTNTDSTPNAAWYLNSVHLVALISYDVAYQCSFNAWLKEEIDEPRAYNRDEIYDGLVGAIAQSEVVQLTDPFGNVYNGFLRPDPGGLRIVDYDTDAAAYREATFGVIFVEAN